MFQSSDCEDCCTSINTSLEDGHTVSRSAKVTQLELSTDIREVLQCPQKAPTIAFTQLRIWDTMLNRCLNTVSVSRCKIGTLVFKDHKHDKATETETQYLLKLLVLGSQLWLEHFLSLMQWSLLFYDISVAEDRVACSLLCNTQHSFV